MDITASWAAYTVCEIARLQSTPAATPAEAERLQQMIAEERETLAGYAAQLWPREPA